MPIGCLLMISLQEDLKLSFKDLAYGKFVDRDTLEVDVGLMIGKVIDRSQAHYLDQQTLRESLQALREAGHDPWQISRGHDMVAILSIGLQKTVGSRRQSDVSPEAIQRMLRLAYTMADFATTRLHESIAVWEKRNAPFGILKHD